MYNTNRRSVNKMRAEETIIVNGSFEGNKVFLSHAISIGYKGRLCAILLIFIWNMKFPKFQQLPKIVMSMILSPSYAMDTRYTFTAALNQCNISKNTHDGKSEDIPPISLLTSEIHLQLHVCKRIWSCRERNIQNNVQLCWCLCTDWFILFKPSLSRNCS